MIGLIISRREGGIDRQLNSKIKKKEPSDLYTLRNDLPLLPLGPDGIGPSLAI